ncbi:MAG: hypothetical protein JRE23_00200 [Deltaproteobacteria bacterium]|nr:hypothetical protein [Deltaproteobacteria bacterium]
MVFDKRWFKQHEKLLLLVANMWPGRFFFGISGSVPRGKQIKEIMPDSVTWIKEKGVYRTEFLNLDKYGHRLYSGLKPFWYLLHFIDWLFSFAPIPRLRFNFGFDTLTVYPAAGANEPVDGYVGRTSGGESFNDLRSNAGTLANVTDIWGPIASLKGGTTSDEFTRIDRGVFLFDTSILDTDATINSATVSLYGDYKENSLGLSDAEAGLALVGAAPADDDALVAADYQSLGAVRYSSDIPFSSFDDFDYNDFVLNAAGLAAISKTGLSRFGTYLAMDLDGGTPSWVSSAITELWVKFVDIGFPATYPKLVVDWTLEAIPGYVTADDEVAVTAFSEVADNVTATDEIEALRFRSIIVDEGDAEATDETDASLITFASELNKKIGAAPVWILKCPFATGTIYLSDRVFSVSGWEGGITTKGWVKRWSAIDEDIASELASPLVSDLSLDFVIDPAATPSIDDILWDVSNDVEKTDCELFLWFLGFEGSGVFPETFWIGNIIDFETLDELTCSVQLIDQSVGINKSIGNKLNTTDWPNADPDDIGKVIPIVYGAVENLQALAIDAGWVTTLAEDIAEGTTSFDITDATGLAALDVIQVEDEQIRIGSISSNTLNGCTRGYSATTATTHDKGIHLGKVQSEYWYLLADHPVKSIGDVFVDGVRQVGGDFTKYTDHSGKAKVKFTALPVLRKSVDIEVDDNITVQDYAVSHNDGINQDAVKITNQNSAEEFDFLSGFTTSQIKTIARFTHPGYSYSEATYTVNCRVNIWASLADVIVSARLNTELNGAGGGTTGPWVAVMLWRNDGLGFNFYTTVLQTFSTLSGGNSYLEVKVESGNANGLSYFQTVSVSRAVKAAASVVGTGVSSKTLANKAKISGGKAYYVGLVGNSSADTVIGSQVTADVDGQPDDGSGTYTGTPNALIERPDHVMKHLLAVHAGFTNFTTDAGSEFQTKGYTFAGVINELKKLRHWTNYLAWQSRCYFRFAGGEAQLLWRPDAITPLKTVTSNMIRRKEDHRTTLRGPKRSPLHEVVNVIDLHYDRDWTKDGEDSYEALESGSDATSIGKYGERQKPELFFFDFVIDQAMAADVLAFYIARLKDRKKEFYKELFLDNTDLTFGKGFTLEPAGDVVCEVLKTNAYPGSGRARRNDRIIVESREY